MGWRKYCGLALLFLFTNYAMARNDFVDGLVAYHHGDYTGAMRVWMPLADHGDPVAQRWVGELYVSGNGVPRDEARALLWWEKAAGGGDFPAYVNSVFLALYLENKTTHLTDDAVSALEVAAQKGDRYAQAKLADHYRFERQPEGYSKAAYWYEKAANQGLAAAAEELGKMYRFGVGVARDGGLATQWSVRAAELGSGTAMRTLGDMYRTGDLVPQSASRASEWYAKGALHADMNAETSLVYFYGRSVADAFFPHGLPFSIDAQHAEPDDPLSIERLGELYLDGSAIAQDTNGANVFCSVAQAKMATELRLFEQHAEWLQRVSQTEIDQKIAEMKAAINRAEQCSVQSGTLLHADDRSIVAKHIAQMLSEKSPPMFLN